MAMIQCAGFPSRSVCGKSLADWAMRPTKDRGTLCPDCYIAYLLDRINQLEAALATYRQED